MSFLFQRLRLFFLSENCTFPIVALLVLLSSGAIAQSEIVKPEARGSSPVFFMKRHYYSFGLDASTIANFKGGFSLGYMHALNQKRNHYVGLQFTGLPGQQSRSMDFIYNGSPTKNAEARTNLSIIIVQLGYHYFFHPDRKSSPFLGFQFGSAFVQNEMETSFDYKSNLPLGWGGWYHYGDDASQNMQTMFTSSVVGGYWINLHKNGGMYLKLGVSYVSPFRFIDVSSVSYSADVLQYSMSTTSPISVSLGVGMLF